MMEEKYKKMEEVTKDTMFSLYDYLHKAAGLDLGKRVAKAASLAKEKLGTREISNPKYTGKVYLYRKEFLDKFFRNEQ